MPRKKLALFVWEDVLYDYTSGVMFALAHDAEEARQLILKKNHLVGYDLGKTPRKVESPEGFALYGGG